MSQVSGVHLRDGPLRFRAATSRTRRRSPLASRRASPRPTRLADAGVSAAREIDGVALAAADPGFDLGASTARPRGRSYRCRVRARRGRPALGLERGRRRGPARWSSARPRAARRRQRLDPRPPRRSGARRRANTCSSRARPESHLARVAAKNRKHGAANPHGLAAASVEEVLASEMLLWPLRRLMVAPPAQRRGGDRARLPEAAAGAAPKAPRVRASICSTARAAAPRPPAPPRARLAYSGVGPRTGDRPRRDRGPDPGRRDRRLRGARVRPRGQRPRTRRQRLHRARRRRPGQRQRRLPLPGPRQRRRRHPPTGRALAPAPRPRAGAARSPAPASASPRRLRDDAGQGDADDLTIGRASRRNELPGSGRLSSAHVYQMLSRHRANAPCVNRGPRSCDAPRTHRAAI